MKKIVLALVTFFFMFVIVGCVEVVTTVPTTTQTPTTTQATTQPTTTQPTTTISGQTTVSGQTTASEQTTVPTTVATTTTIPKVIMDLPDAEVDITFWHIYGAGKSAVLDQLIVEFEAMYPNVTINSVAQSDYNTLREKINLGISVGQVPTMALGYPDHFAAYITTGAVLSLDNYINSNVAYEVLDSTSSIVSQLVDVGVDLNDFPESYLAENNQYIGGHYYSMPFSKSTETMAVNRTVLKAHVTEIRAMGITISDEGFLSHSTPLTFAQLQQLSTILVNETAVTDVANFQCGYLLNYDSSGNMFINMSRQWKAPYTNSSGAILINNDTTKNMLNYIKAMFNARTFVLPVVWGQLYGSANFILGDVCMTVGSTAGVAYNIPTGTDVLEKFGKFEVDFLTVPQTVTASDTPVTMSSGTNDYNITGALSAVQQGPNIGIFSSANSNQKLFAWLFIKWLMTTENTAKWAMSTGYLPARLSSYTSDVQIDLTTTFSITYTEFMHIAQDYWTADGLVTWELTDERWDYLYSSMVANVAMSQTSFYQYDPAFAAGSVSSGSAQVRVEAGYCLENVYTGTYSPTGALSFMVNQLIWG